MRVEEASNRGNTSNRVTTQTHELVHFTVRPNNNEDHTELRGGVSSPFTVVWAVKW